MRYATREKPEVGDVVSMKEGAPRTVFRPAGSRGTVYKLGEAMKDPVRGLVFVKWDSHPEHEDDDIFCCDLNLLERG